MEITAEAKKRIAFLIEDSGTPLSALAAKIGVSQSTLWNFVNGSTKNFSKIHRLATELKVSLDWIMHGDISATKSETSASSPLFRAAEPGAGSNREIPTIPIFAQIIGTDDDMQIDRRRVIGDIERHPGQKGIKDSFALYAVGKTMVPRYRPGELIYVVSGKLPVKGQDCVVELANGDCYLREYVSQKSGVLICRQLNPAKDAKWKVAAVKAIHAVVGRG